MKLIEFYKYYYDKTFKSFPDETPYARGINISKKNRKQYLVFAYITLCLCLLSIPLAFIFINYWALVCMFIGSFAFLSLVIILLAEYNILTIYRCYKIYNRDDVYSKFLKSSWFGSNDYHLIKNNLNIKGLKHGRIYKGFFESRFTNKYIIPFENGDKILFIMKTNKAILKYKGCKKVFNEKYDKLTALFDDIRKELLEMIDSQVK